MEGEGFSMGEGINGVGATSGFYFLLTRTVGLLSDLEKSTQTMNNKTKHREIQCQPEEEDRSL